MTDLDTLTGIFEKIVTPMFKYAVPRLGKVVDVNDKEGRVLALVPSLGWDTKDKATWCFPTDKKSLIVPKVNDFVLIEWIDSNPDIPMYRGIASNLKDMIPKIYSGNPKFSVLFESNEEKISITYDEEKNLMKIGKSDFRKSARVDDTIKSTSSEDSAFWTFWSTFLGIITGTPINEPGNGAPSAFQTALSLALTPLGTPSSLDGKITSGSEQVEVGDK